MGAKRIGRGGYWGWMVSLTAVAVGAVVMMIALLAQLDLGQVAVCLLIVVAIGLWMRVVQMWRCRDIGWPAFLPWLMFGLLFVANFMAGMAILSSAASGDLAQLSAAMAGAGSTSVLLGLLDFGFFVLIGCLRGSDRDTLSPQHHQPGAWHRQGHAEGDEADDPIARAVANYQRTGSAVPQAAARPIAPMTGRPVPPARPGGGFGRRAV